MLTWYMFGQHLEGRGLQGPALTPWDVHHAPGHMHAGGSPHCQIACAL